MRRLVEGGRECVGGGVSRLSCLSASPDVISIRGVGCGVFCFFFLLLSVWRFVQVAELFLRRAPFFWQLDSLDLDSISLDRRSWRRVGGFSRRGSLFFFHGCVRPPLRADTRRHQLK